MLEWVLPLLLLAPVRATVVSGVIDRDAATKQAIASTAAVRLDPSRRDAYRLVVLKARYRLDVLEGDRLVKAFPVALGPAPEGEKRREGDGRTPEGEYALVPHHASPEFGSCFYVCYPGERDGRTALREGRIRSRDLDAILGAQRRGERPPENTPLGGLILLHGVRQRDATALTASNWTLGCIAMENGDLLELLSVYRASDRPRLTIRP